MKAPLHHTALLATLGMSSMALAGQNADAAGRVFADNCFSPYLTAEIAHTKIGRSGARVDFYDLRPFSNVAPSPVTGRAATPGTDRRCEVAFDGAQPQTAMEWLAKGLRQEGLSNRTTPVPADFTPQHGVLKIAAAQLNPNRIAVVQVGTRPGPAGTETYMSVERLMPLDANQ